MSSLRQKADILSGGGVLPTSPYGTEWAKGTLAADRSNVCRFDPLSYEETGVLQLRYGVPSMCDYSLELVASRPAKVGDKLISTGFRDSVSRGFASLDDLNVAVCLAPGTELAFEEEVKCDAGIVFSRRLSHKVASFRQIDTSKPNRHHDELEFTDGKIVLLTCLCKG